MSRHRIEIPEGVAASESVPRDLDAGAVGAYAIPDTRRRRRAGLVLLSGAALALAAPLAGLPAGMAVAGGVLLALGAWSIASAWPIRVLDPEALEIAGRRVGFPVGHSSAAVGFDGWLARPVWNILIFEASDPPSRRALVRVDAVDGRVVEEYVEDLTDRLVGG
ncbi:MAG: hypothetical protein QY307_00570 [Acidimicrobiia bacterium]|nr:MAG: hypothetical protein QY307_00570 [Acidimicrobiia bacterium]